MDAYQMCIGSSECYHKLLSCQVDVCCIQVYTVGPDYAHAEARKSPALDGKVERNKDGKEIRYPVLLSAKEKLLARTVCLAFKVLGIIFTNI